MSLQNATPALFAFARYFSRPLCPNCGTEQMVPENSEFTGLGRVRHAWLCDECGHDFCTDVELGNVSV
jgi:hypothetical protein